MKNSAKSITSHQTSWVMLFILLSTNFHCANSECPEGTSKVSKDNIEECVKPSGVRHGAYLKKYKNGQTLTKGYYINGLQEGKWETWWSNGNRKVECSFKNGGLHGVYREWHSNGQFYFEAEYEKGIKIRQYPFLEEQNRLTLCCDQHANLEICMTKDGVSIDEILNSEERISKSQSMCRHARQ